MLLEKESQGPSGGQEPTWSRRYRVLVGTKKIWSIKKDGVCPNNLDGKARVSVVKQEVFSCCKNRRYLESAFGCSVVEELERKVQCMDEKELLVAN